MDITNNIFIYINDILQTPQSSYTFKEVESSLQKLRRRIPNVQYSTLEDLRRDVETIEPSTTFCSW